MNQVIIYLKHSNPHKWTAISPTLPEHVSDGATIEEAISPVREALESYVRSNLAETGEAGEEELQVVLYSLPRQKWDILPHVVNN